MRIAGLALLTCVAVFCCVGQCVAEGGVGEWSWNWLSPYPTGATLNDVACKDDQCVAVGANGAIVISSNGGLSWATYSSPVRAHLYSVCQWERGFLACGTGGVMLRIIPPSTTSAGEPFTGSFDLSTLRVTDNTLVLAAFDSVSLCTILLTSTNAETWSTNFVFPRFYGSAIASGKGVTFLFGFDYDKVVNVAYRSTNLVNWESLGPNFASPQLTMNHLRFAGDYFFGLPFLKNLFLVSSNGYNWHSITIPANLGNTVFNDVVDDRDTYDLVGSFWDGGNHVVMMTSGFSNWTAGPVVANFPLYSAAKSSDHLIAVGVNGRIWTSPQGSNHWAAIEDSRVFYQSVVIENIAILLLLGNYLYSTNGITWLTNNYPAGRFLQICAGNGRFVAMDDAWPRRTWTSTNGVDCQFSADIGYTYSDGYPYEKLRSPNRDCRRPRAAS